MIAAGVLILLTGAAALVCQVAWQRVMALHSGIGAYSVAIEGDLRRWWPPEDDASASAR